MQQEFSLTVGSKTLTLTVNDWAMQASGSVVAQYGQTVVLATVTQGEKARTGIDYFPLMVDYDERFYAGGKIGGSRFVRREGKPSDEAVLSARMIDRSLRPLFDHEERRDVQVVITILSFDKENDPDILALIASSFALMISPIPFDGPVASLRMGYMDGKYIVNPSYEGREKSELDLVLAGSKDKIMMVEGRAKETSEEVVNKAFHEGLALINKMVDFQIEAAKKVGVRKIPVPAKEQSAGLAQFIGKFSKKALSTSLFKDSDIKVKDSIAAIHNDLMERVAQEFGDDARLEAEEVFYDLLSSFLQEKALKEDIRADGRKSSDLRTITCQVGVLPRTHGSALFKRGMTHALSVVTLGAPGDELLVDTMETEEKRHYMHHYNFPPFSVGEVKPMRGPSRRDLGHGYLAQRALEPVLPSKGDFPYTIRVVTEILSSNGSSSMASACGSSLALMDAGVPISRPVAGIAMGLFYESDKNFKVLTDIQGPEDHNGKMDCKVAGTTEGITAIQMDTKTKGLTLEILKQSLAQAKDARLQILKNMNATIGKSRENLSPLAPHVLQIRIDPAKIRFVIGPGGEMINNIIEKTGAEVDIEDDGRVFITGQDEKSAASAKRMVEEITREYKQGDVLDGTISGIKDFGAFVKVGPGKEGLVHISELAEGYVKSVEEVVSLGDKVQARVIAVDKDGKLRLSLKAGNNESRSPKQKRI